MKMLTHGLLQIIFCIVLAFEVNGQHNRTVLPKETLIEVPNICGAGVIRIINARLFNNTSSGNLDTNSACDVTRTVFYYCEWMKICTVVHPALVAIHHCAADQFLEITYDCFVFSANQRQVIQIVDFIRLTEVCGENVIKISSAKILANGSSEHPIMECDVTDYVWQQCEWRTSCELRYHDMVYTTRCYIEDYFEISFTCFNATRMAHITDALFEATDVVLISPGFHGFHEHTYNTLPSKCTIRSQYGQSMYIQQIVEFREFHSNQALTIIGLDNRKVYLPPYYHDDVVKHTALIGVELTEILITYDAESSGFWVVLEIKASSFIRVNCQTGDLFPDYPTSHDTHCTNSLIPSITPINNDLISSTKNKSMPHNITGKRLVWPDSAVSLIAVSSLVNATLLGLILAFSIIQRRKNWIIKRQENVVMYQNVQALKNEATTCDTGDLGLYSILTGTVNQTSTGMYTELQGIRPTEDVNPYEIN